MTAILDIVNLRVDIKTPLGILHAVRGIDIKVEKGKTLGIVGESGCGKSLTMMAILDLLPKNAECTADRLNFCGNDLQSMDKPKLRNIYGNEISIIFQDPMTSLNPAYTIGDQLTEIYLCHKKASKVEAVERAIYLLERVGITAAASRLRQYPHQLSGGLRQRVMIAMALMCEPALLIADEPTTALDVTIQAQILHLIKDLQKEFGTSVIFITHDLGVIAQMADQIVIMYAGKIVEQGTIKSVFNKPGHPYTQGLLDCIPIRGKVKKGQHLGTIPGIVPSLIGDISGCAFRTRCKYAQEACVNKLPRQGTPTHNWRCIMDEIPSTKIQTAI